MPKDDKDREAERKKRQEPMPPAGPHARDDLTDYSKTPGTGALPDKRSGGSETDNGTG